MWHFIGSRPTFQIDGGTMNIFSRNKPGVGDDLPVQSAEGSMEYEDARGAPPPGATARSADANLRVGFAACFPTRVKDQYTEHWVLFSSFRSPRVANEGSVKRAVNPLILESAEPEDVLPGGWRNETEFLEKVRAFLAKRPEYRYIRHNRFDSLGSVP
jgi:hypothetical protein